MHYALYLQNMTRLGSTFRLFKGSFMNKSSLKLGQSIRRLSSEETKKALKPNGTKKNAQLSKSDLSRLFSLAKPERARLISAIGLLFISSGVTLAVPYGIGRVLDIIYTTQTEEERQKRLNEFCGLLLGIFIIGAVGNIGRFYLMQSSAQRIAKRFRERIYSAIVNQKMEFFDKRKTGELINRLSADTQLVSYSVTMNISDGLRSLCSIVGGVGMMLWTSAQLSLVGLSIVPAVAIGSIMYGRFLKKMTKKVQDALAESTHVAEERLSNMITVKSFAKESDEVVRYSDKLQQVLKLQLKETSMSAAFWGFTGLSGNVIVLSVFYYGGIMMSTSSLTMGDLSSFLLYAAYVGVALGGLSSFYSELMRGTGASQRLFQLLDSKGEKETETKSSRPVLLGDLKFENVTFHYSSRPDANVLNNMNLVLRAGISTALVGPSGCGKSSIVALLLKLYTPESGLINLNGHNLSDMDTDYLRENISYVPQEPTLFSMSVEENIKYGKPNATEEEVKEALENACALNFVNAFPDGLQTLVGERGAQLSGGQKQRIALARALIKKPDILILDEATSALDTHSEQRVHDNLRKIMKNKTVITIAHRLSTIKQADNIVVLEKGKVAEEGSFHELIRSNGLFKDLTQRQMNRETHTNYED
ncbi:DgyrCDS9794 [Dimorphilus gyrociliatus]|uniref:DgyrCDS9794 n=1 Tax=Dimorphilus gyrociliatus TaxID=2664684 RepID=A0A7I8VZF8_9ANNE|nr:DgyrCDS9794 [Dimorphilus gyrociliatus]